MKSLLDKAIHGTGTSITSSATSLFTRALALRSPIHEDLEVAEIAEVSEVAETVTSFDTSGFNDLRRDLAAVPPNFDSILKLWSLISERLPLAAVALFLPKEGFLIPAAQNGFPLGLDDSIPLSLFSASSDRVEALDSETKALFAPILGVPFSLSLRASAMRSTSDLFGLWIYHDPVLETSKSEIQAELDALLSRAAENLPPFSMTTLVADPARVLLDAALKYPSASAFVFDLSSFGVGKDEGLRGIKPIAICSSFLNACDRILSQSGMALALGDQSIGCMLGSASTVVDPDLVLFQFRKTLKRIMPYLASASFPEGRALRFDPSSKDALEELSRFLSK